MCACVHVKLLCNLFPSLQLSLADWDKFLAGAVSRNRPRGVLVSPSPHPPLSLRLTALLLRGYMDFGYVCSDTSSHPQQAVLLGRLGADRGSKTLLVFKEYPEPAVMVEVQWLCMCVCVCVFVCVCVCVCVCECFMLECACLWEHACVFSGCAHM